MIVKICLSLMLATLVAAVSKEEAWKNFMSSRPMTFPSAEEAAQRKANFFAAHDVIEEHNSKPGVTFQLAHNQFSLMTENEKKSYLGARPTRHPKNRTRSAYPSDRACPPTSVDYRNDPCMQPIKNQGSCGSCWAFAAIAVVEFNSCVRSGKSVALSEQQLVDCSTANYGCNGGWQSVALQYIAKAGSVNTAAAYPYTSAGGTSGTCKYNAANKGAVVSATNPVTYINSGDTKTMMAMVAAKSLVTVDFAVVNSFFSYKSGVYTEKNCNQNIVGYHAMTVVGYGTLNGIPYWIIRNSWASGWGVGGYVFFQRDANLCGIEKHAVGTTIIG